MAKESRRVSAGKQATEDGQGASDGGQWLTDDGADDAAREVNSMGAPDFFFGIYLTSSRSTLVGMAAQPTDSLPEDYPKAIAGVPVVL